jgi:hypothetical protein
MGKTVLIENHILKTKHKLVICHSEEPLIFVIETDYPAHGGEVQHPPFIVSLKKKR